MAEEVNMDRIEIIEAASTLISLRRHCDERIRWQRSRNTLFPPTPPVFNPFNYGHIWPFYKHFPYDVTALPLMHHHHHHPPFPFQVSPYMVGPPRPWFPAPQVSFPSPLRNTEGLAESLPSTPISSTPPRTSRIPVAMKTSEGSLHDDNDDSGEQDETTTVTSDKYDHKRKRRNLTKRQQEILEKAYYTTKYPHIDERLRLSKATQLTEDRIQIWFQNRRAKDRRMTDGIKSPPQKSAELEINENPNHSNGAVHVKVEEEDGEDGTQCAPGDDDEYCREPSPKRIKQEK